MVALSGGQMQRVALARSLVYRPQLLLLDEPLSNLDAKLRIRLRDDLRRILKQAGMTALYVTHDQSEAVALGDRIGVMREGKLLQLGTPDQIYNRPADLFVANFTGATNEITGRLIESRGEVGLVDVAGQRLEALLITPVARRRGRADRGAAGKHRARPPGCAATPTAPKSPSGAISARRPSTMSICWAFKLEALELGTAIRHEGGEDIVASLPPATCWAYRDTGAIKAE